MKFTAPGSNLVKALINHKTRKIEFINPIVSPGRFSSTAIFLSENSLLKEVAIELTSLKL